MFREQYYDGFRVNDSKTYGQRFLRMSQSPAVCQDARELMIKAKLGVRSRVAFMEGWHPNLAVVLTCFHASVGWTDNPFCWLNLDHRSSSHPRPWNTEHRCQNGKEPEIIH